MKTICIATTAIVTKMTPTSNPNRPRTTENKTLHRCYPNTLFDYGGRVPNDPQHRHSATLQLARSAANAPKRHGELTAVTRDSTAFAFVHNCIRHKHKPYRT
eukprot:315840-Amphidinium_carterae.1